MVENKRMSHDPSVIPERTEERNRDSIPRKKREKVITVGRLICQISSITRVTRNVVIIITPVSAIPVGICCFSMTRAFTSFQQKI